MGKRERYGRIGSPGSMTWYGRGAMAQEAARSHKLSPVGHEDYLNPTTGRLFKRPIPRAPFASSTYASIRATCPDDCNFKDRGCYAQLGFTAQAVLRLDAEAGDGLEVIKEEARLINGLFHGRGVPQDGARGGRDLRLHVSGDAPTEAAEEGARELAAAARRWRIRGGGAVWTYTHQWRRAPRAAWGPVSVLASCDIPYEVAMANDRGYPAALVVAGFPSARAFEIEDVPGRKIKVVPCPAQTREGANCAECRLCLDKDLLGLGITIGFAAHGAKTSDVLETAWAPEEGPRRRARGLVVLQGGR